MRSEADIRSGWKVLTHDGRSPLQGGPPVLTGPLPITLPTVLLDTGAEECAAGWNYVADIPTGWCIAGMWPTGYSTRLFVVEASRDAIQRRTKRRASSLTLIREATDEELYAALMDFSAPFGAWQDRMADEQWKWLTALRRHHYDAAAVKAHLDVAVSARGLPWALRRLDDDRDAWAAWDAGAAWDAWAAWDARDAQAAWDAWAAWEAGAAGAAWVAWDARDDWDAWAAWATWDAGVARAAGAAGAAKVALVTCYSRLMGGQPGDPEQYAVGIRDAYAHGLARAWPVEPNILGWIMAR